MMAKLRKKKRKTGIRYAHFDELTEINDEFKLPMNYSVIFLACS